MFTSHYQHLKNYSGMILMELMLAAALGLLIVSAILKIYLVSQQSFRLQTSINQIQDNAKIAIKILSSEIHLAGYIGCPKLTDDFPLVAITYPLTVKNKLIGTPTSITARHASLNNVALIKSMSNRSMLEVSDQIHFKKNNILIVSDCKHVEIFQIKNIIYSHGVERIIPATPLHYLFKSYAEVARYEVNHFFVSSTKRNDAYGKPIYGLYVKDLQGNTVRLVEGINALNIQYIMNQTLISAIKIDFEVASTPLRKIWHAYVSL